MKKSIKWIALAVVLVVLLVGAYALYNKYSEEFKGDNLSQATQTTKPEQASQEQGQKTDLAPDFTVYDEKGNEVKLSDYRGKPVVLNFWATWCYYCKEEMQPSALYVILKTASREFFISNRFLKHWG